MRPFLQGSGGLPRDTTRPDIDAPGSTPSGDLSHITQGLGLGVTALLASTLLMSTIPAPGNTALSEPPTTLAPDMRSTSAQDFVSSLAEVFQRSHTLQAILRELRELPLEDGLDHPAELRLAASSEHELDTIIFYTAFGEYVRAATTTQRAEILRLLGRHAIPHHGRNLLVHLGLSSPSAAMRDAAIQAIESWEAREFAHILQEHEDEEPWLQAYARDVASDLMEV